MTRDPIVDRFQLVLAGNRPLDLCHVLAPAVVIGEQFIRATQLGDYCMDL